ncbi:hypothetical protein ACHAXA_004204 [Cyclostephanos tholiformis]|uniref:Protein kinase domain-containing protein n=1 Tax=Cyclostephanos tholiformis TaxID=382380 RepID=A0ABD3RBN1_9STRA
MGKLGKNLTMEMNMGVLLIAPTIKSIWNAKLSIELDDPSHVVPYCRFPPDDNFHIRYGDVGERYDVDPRILGTGQQGSVRRCIDRITGEVYAIKSIRKDNPHVVPRDLKHEIETLRFTRHCGIIRLIDVIEDDTHVHLVTDLCEGGELYERIIARSSSSTRGDDDDHDVPCFTEGEAAKILRQILDALSHMHELGIAHRDIKPENVMFATTDDDSSIRLIDLGTSRRHCNTSERPMSRVVGTPHYIAPEVLRGKYDKSCDLWSVGVVAYVLLCGYLPFNGDTNPLTYEFVLRGICDYHAEDWKNIGVDAMDFVQKLLDINPGRRMTARQALDHPWMMRNARRAI